MAFSDEADFERVLITVLFDKGWSPKVIQYPTEKDLIRNWADIQNGNLTVEPMKTFTDYIAEYAERAKNDQIHQFADVFGARTPFLVG